jgi:hypothetical protein
MKIVINDLVDLIWEGKPVIFVAGRRFNQCSFLAVTVPPEKLHEVGSIDDMVSLPEARTLEGIRDVDEYLHEVDDLEPGEHVTEETIMQAHASNLIAWVENDYNPGILNTNLSFPLLKKLAEAGDKKAERVLKSEIRDRVLNGSYLSRMAMAELGMNELFDAETLTALAKDADPDVRFEAAKDARTPVPVLDVLARDPYEAVRYAVADNPSSSECAFRVLAKDDDAEVRIGVAGNEKAPGYILTMLANDDDVYIRKSVAANEMTSPEILEYLAMNDVSNDVRSVVVFNKKMPIDVIRKMALNDADNYVRDLARKVFLKRRSEV